MNNIKTNFSIKDLENLSNIKAHTIRIWEKRYNLLSPSRTDTNIRTYSLDSLQKLLNISYLNKNGIKISKIANLSDQDINIKVREIASRADIEDHAINAFKIAMINFDQVLFYNTYNTLIETKSFSTIFYTIFLPLLNHIGVLWQTNTITPAHEHFLSIHIKQKILLNIERLQLLAPQPDTKTFILFLPENEIHDIGLLFINYQLRSKGYHSIFLGESVPMDNLRHVLDFYQPVTFISYLTIFPEDDKLNDYIHQFESLLLHGGNQLYLLGKKLDIIKDDRFPDSITRFTSIESLVNIL